MENKFVEYAPWLVVAFMFFWQNNIFAKPEQLEKKHREILKEVDDMLKKNYVELNAYKEFQAHVCKGIDDANDGINDLKEFLMGKHQS